MSQPIKLVVLMFVSGAVFAQQAVDYVTQLKNKGAVVMVHDNSVPGKWSVSIPGGGKLSTAGDPCQGLQTAINYAHDNAYPLFVYGGGFKFDEPAPPSNISCTDTLKFPTGHGNHYYFYGINLNPQPGNGKDCITFDSTDFTMVDFEESQIVCTYDSTHACLHWLPTNPNGEGVIGIGVSQFKFGTIFVNASAGPVAQWTVGANSNTSVAGSTFQFQEINGAVPSTTTIGWQIDDPPNGVPFFEDNRFIANAIHSVAIGFKCGTSANAANKIFGNVFDAQVVASTIGGTGVDMWCGRPVAGFGNTFMLRGLAESNSKIVVHSSSGGNVTICSTCTREATLSGGDSGTGNLWIFSPTAVTLVAAPGGTCSAGTCILQNAPSGAALGRTMTVALDFTAGGTLNNTFVSADGVTYVPAYPPTTSFTLLPGMYLKVLYAGTAPTLYESY